MSDNNTPVTVRLLDREFHVMSPAAESEKLQNAAKLLDTRMREIRSSGRVVGLERIAVMAALNLAYELLNNDNGNASETQQTLLKLSQKIDDTLSEGRQLTFD